MRVIWLLAVVIAASGNSQFETEPFDAPKFGMKVEIPKAWKIAVQERDERIFVALIPQLDPAHPGVAACELGLAPEALEEYRYRIQENAKRDANFGEPSRLLRNEILKSPSGDRLETLKEYEPKSRDDMRESQHSNHQESANVHVYSEYR